MIVPCTCDSAFQDERYGKGKRVANLTKKGTSGSEIHRCTVCSKEHAAVGIQKQK